MRGKLEAETGFDCEFIRCLSSRSDIVDLSYRSVSKEAANSARILFSHESQPEAGGAAFFIEGGYNYVEYIHHCAQTQQQPTFEIAECGVHCLEVVECGIHGLLSRGEVARAYRTFVPIGDAGSIPTISRTADFVTCACLYNFVLFETIRGLLVRAAVLDLLHTPVCRRVD